jgi:hypothetical protein
VPAHRAPRRKLRLIATSVIAAAVVLGLQGVTVNADAAATASGPAPAPRTADAVGEVIAYYQQFLGRTPDSSGLNHYLLGAYADCRKGVTDAAWSMANSGEAHAFLNANDRKTNAIYAGFLNRQPDDKGWHDQKAGLDNGTSWDQISRNVLSSPEYQARLDSVCRDAVANESAICTAAGAGTQGPPSASIPPDLQPFFNCYGSRGSGGTVTAECLHAAVTSIIGAGLSGKDALEKIKSGGKLTLKKIGPVGWVLTIDGLVMAFRDCT